MKAILVLLFSVCCMSVFAQQSVYPDSGFTNKAEAKNLMVSGKKEGKWCEYYRHEGIYLAFTTDTNSDSYRLVVYKSGIINGALREYIDGKFVKEAMYVNGLQNGIEKDYYESGKLQWLVNYIDDTICGPKIGYYESGRMQWRSYYDKGKENGITTEYYENENKKMEVAYFKGKQQGLEKEYYLSGKVKRVTPYNNDVIDGEQFEYYEDGEMESKTTWQNGFKGSTENFAKMAPIELK